jgi:hypothetical protein
VQPPFVQWLSPLEPWMELLYIHHVFK